MTWAPRGISTTKSSSVGRSTVYSAPRVERTTAPSGAPDDVGVGHEAGVAVELAALG